MVLDLLYFFVLNLTHAPASNTQSQPQPDASMLSPYVQNTTGSDFSNFSNQFGSSRGRGGRGRGGCFTNVQCQVCFKFGHPAFSCWHRFNQQFQVPIPPNFQGSMLAAGDPYHAYNSGMSPYGPTHSGYGVSPTGYGVNMAYNPFQQWQRPPAPQQQRPPAPQQQRPPSFQYGFPSAMITNAPSTSGSSNASTTWFPDSVASFHVTGDARNIQEHLAFDGPEQIFIGNGQGLDIHSSGSSVFTSPIKPQTTLTLNHLLHVPTITKNLISVGQFARANSVFFEFHADHCVVKSKATKEVLLHGKVGSDGLYTFPSVSLQSAKALFG